MVNKCAAVSCQSGYAEQSSLPHKSDPSPSTTFHKFTMDECYENDGVTLIQEKIRLQANIQKCALYIFMKMTLKQFTATQIRPEPRLLNGP